MDDRESLGDAIVHALPRNLDAAAVDAAPLRQNSQQLAVAASDVEHLGATLDHVGDEQEIDAKIERRVALNSLGAPMRVNVPWWVWNLFGEQAVFLLRRK